jgi:hypothetical protein
MQIIKMRKVVMIAIIVLFTMTLYGQDSLLCKCEDNWKINENTEFCNQPEKKPSFPGGEKKMIKFLKSNSSYTLLTYKETDSNTDYERLYFCIELNENGDITKHVIKSNNSDYEKDMKRLINMMPNWKPAEQMDIPVIGMYRYLVFYHE